MLTLELPNGTHMDFENTEALELALQRMREGKPIVVRDEHDGKVACCGSMDASPYVRREAVPHVACVVCVSCEIGA
jgi:hypothetical protein